MLKLNELAGSFYSVLNWLPVCHAYNVQIVSVIYIYNIIIVDIVHVQSYAGTITLL